MKPFTFPNKAEALEFAKLAVAEGCFGTPLLVDFGFAVQVSLWVKSA